MTYGTPYKGSKSQIAEWVVSQLPSAEVFVDLFAGGCAVTHSALRSGRWRRVVANDISDAPLFFRNAIRGDYHNRTHFVGREEFFRRKESDPFVRYVWSFGNNGEDYIYSRVIEDYKRAWHEEVVSKRECGMLEWYGIHLSEEAKNVFYGKETWQERRQWMRYYVQNHEEEMREAIRRFHEEHPHYEEWGEDEKGGMRVHYREKGEEFYNINQSLASLASLANLGSLQRLESLESLERLQRLESLESLDHKLTISRVDYADFKMPEGETFTVYCDPPYRGTDCGSYAGFDHDRFDEWLRKTPYPVYVSEYTMPADFKSVAVTGKRSLSSGKGAGALKEEGIYIHERWLGEMKRGSGVQLSLW